MTKQDYNYIINYKNKPYSRYFDYYLKTYSTEKIKAYNDIARRPDVCATPDIVSCSRFNFVTVYTSDRGEFVIDTISYTHRYTLNDLAKYEKRLKRQKDKKQSKTIEEIKAAKALMFSEALEYIQEEHSRDYSDILDYLLPEINIFIDNCYPFDVLQYTGRVDDWVFAYFKKLISIIDNSIIEAKSSYNKDKEEWSYYMDAIL